jgi:NADH:ubiquinone oxidoreductase subunit 6 (subunit J)
MSDKAELFVFWPVAVLLVASAIGVVRARNPVYAAMSLVAAFFLLAGLYVMLAAHLVAFLQIMVYAGAIMVLFLFVIMLLSLSDAELGFVVAMKWLARSAVGLWRWWSAIRQAGRAIKAEDTAPSAVGSSLPVPSRGGTACCWWPSSARWSSPSRDRHGPGQLLPAARGDPRHMASPAGGAAQRSSFQARPMLNAPTSPSSLLASAGTSRHAIAFFVIAVAAAEAWGWPSSSPSSAAAAPSTSTAHCHGR